MSAHHMERTSPSKYLLISSTRLLYGASQDSDRIPGHLHCPAGVNAHVVVWKVGPHISPGSSLRPLCAGCRLLVSSPEGCPRCGSSSTRLADTWWPAVTEELRRDGAVSGQRVRSHRCALPASHWLWVLWPGQRPPLISPRDPGHGVLMCLASLA